MKYDEWAASVLTILAVRIPAVTLESLRADEPRDAWTEGDNPQDYVESLIAELNAFGPRGE